MTKGSRAILGTGYRMYITGENSLSALAFLPISMPSKNPAASDINTPDNIRPTLYARCTEMTGANLLMMCKATVKGAGKNAIFNMTEASCHSSSKNTEAAITEFSTPL
jgi:hypothetical protein